MLAQCRRWANIVPTLGECLAGFGVIVNAAATVSAVVAAAVAAAAAIGAAAVPPGPGLWQDTDTDTGWIQIMCC